MLLQGRSASRAGRCGTTARCGDNKLLVVCVLYTTRSFCPPLCVLFCHSSDEIFIQLNVYVHVCYKGFFDQYEYTVKLLKQCGISIQEVRSRNFLASPLWTILRRYVSPRFW